MKQALAILAVMTTALGADPAPTRTATVYVYRTKVRFMARALRPSIYCDGLELRQLANGEYFVDALPTGKHMISAGRTEVGQLVDLEPDKAYFFKLDHKNVFVSNWSGRQPMTLTSVPENQARTEIEGLKRVTARPPSPSSAGNGR